MHNTAPLRLWTTLRGGTRHGEEHDLLKTDEPHPDSDDIVARWDNRKQGRNPAITFRASQMLTDERCNQRSGRRYGHNPRTNWAHRTTDISPPDERWHLALVLNAMDGSDHSSVVVCSRNDSGWSTATRLTDFPNYFDVVGRASLGTAVVQDYLRPANGTTADNDSLIDVLGLR